MSEAWGQTVQHIGPSIDKLIEAEKKASIVLMANSIRHCLEKLSDLLMPIAFLPTKALSASEINALKQAEVVLRQLKNHLETIDIDPEPFHLCQKILRIETGSGPNVKGHLRSKS